MVLPRAGGVRIKERSESFLKARGKLHFAEDGFLAQSYDMHMRIPCTRVSTFQWPPAKVTLERETAAATGLRGGPCKRALGATGPVPGEKQVPSASPHAPCLPLSRREAVPSPTGGSVLPTQGCSPRFSALPSGPYYSQFVSPPVSRHLRRCGVETDGICPALMLSLPAGDDARQPTGVRAATAARSRPQPP